MGLTNTLVYLLCIDPTENPNAALNRGATHMNPCQVTKVGSFTSFQEIEL